MKEVTAYCPRDDKMVTIDLCYKNCHRYHSCDTVADMNDEEAKLEFGDNEEEEK